MTAVLGVSRLLEATELTSEQQQYLQMITASGKLLLLIINGVIHDQIDYVDTIEFISFIY